MVQCALVLLLSDPRAAWLLSSAAWLPLTEMNVYFWQSCPQMGWNLPVFKFISGDIWSACSIRGCWFCYMLIKINCNAL